MRLDLDDKDIPTSITNLNNRQETPVKDNIIK